MIIVCTSKSGYTSRVSGRSDYGSMRHVKDFEIGGDTNVRRVYSDQYWREAKGFEIDLFEAGHNNLEYLMHF